MASRLESVTLIGLLRGQGHDVDCTVRAVKVTQPGTGFVAYGQFAITRVSRVLPPGNYELSVNGETRSMLHENGEWVAAV